MIAVLLRLAERGLDNKVIFLSDIFEIDYKSEIATLNALMIDYTKLWIGPEKPYKPHYPYSGVLLQTHRRYTDKMNAMDEAKKVNVAAGVVDRMGWSRPGGQPGPVGGER